MTTPALVAGHTTAQDISATTSRTISTPTYSSGQEILIFVTASITSSNVAASGFTALPNFGPATLSGGEIYILHKTAASEGASYTISSASCIVSAIAVAVSNYGGIHAVGTNATGTSATATAPAVVTYLANTLRISVIATDDNPGVTSVATLSGHSLLATVTGSSKPTISVQHKNLTGTGSDASQTAALSGSETWTGITFAIYDIAEARITKAGAYLEVLDAQVNITKAGVYLELINNQVRVTKAGVYVEIVEAAQVRATALAAYVELVEAAPTEFVRATALGAYVELASQSLVLATALGAYVELVEPLIVPAPVITADAYSPYAILLTITYTPTGDEEAIAWEYSTNGGETWTHFVDTLPFVATYKHFPLTPNTTYCYRARAFGTAYGPYSNVACATTLIDHELADGVGLWIDVYDAAGNKLGPGPLVEIAGWRNGRRLSRAGDFSVEFPATYIRLHQIQDDGDPLLANDRYLYCYGILADQITLLGAGIVKEIDLARRPGQPPMIVASGPDLLGELRRVTVYTDYRPWQYTAENVNTAPADLIGTFAIAPELPDDWLITGELTTATNVTAKFVHATLLGALGDIGSKIGEYFRLGNTNSGRDLYWIGPPANFDDSGISAELNVDPVAAENNPHICLITDIQEIKDSWDLFTRAFVFGAGQGHDRLDLSAVTHWPDGHRYRSNITAISGDSGTVTVTTATAHDLTVGETIEIAGTVNYDGLYFVDAVIDSDTFEFADAGVGAETVGMVFGDNQRTIDAVEWRIERTQTSLENRTARLTYGRHHTALQFKEISPLTNSDADVSTAANALLLATYHWLRTHSEPARFYRLAVAKLDQLLYPGQLIRVVAKGFVDDASYIDIDRYLTILEVNSEIAATGLRTTGLVVSTVERWPASDGEQASQEFHQAEVYQSLAQLGPTVDTISYLEHVDDDTGAVFNFFLGEEIVAVNSVLVRFRTDKLRSTVKSVGGSSTSTGSGGGATPTSASGGGGTVTSAGGGGTTESTDSGSGHTHEVDLADSTSGSQVYFAGVGTPPVGDLRTSGGGQINTSSTGSGHTHDVDIPSHTHNVTVPGHTHSVTVPSHTHDVTASITALYGIYEDPGTAYGPTDLEFSINGGAWRSDYSAITGASGWYALDITSDVVGLAQRPYNVVNTVAVRVKAASYADLKAQITAQIERRCVIQSIAQF